MFWGFYTNPLIALIILNIIYNVKLGSGSWRTTELYALIVKPILANQAIGEQQNVSQSHSLANDREAWRATVQRAMSPDGRRSWWWWNALIIAMTVLSITIDCCSGDGTVTDFVNCGLKTVPEPVNSAFVYKYSYILETSHSELHCHRFSVTKWYKRTVNQFCHLSTGFQQ